MAVTWTTPRWRRLLMWVMRWGAPSLLGHVPTFREAWTGRVPTSVWGAIDWQAEPLPRPAVELCEGCQRRAFEDLARKADEATREALQSCAVNVQPGSHAVAEVHDRLRRERWR